MYCFGITSRFRLHDRTARDQTALDRVGITRIPGYIYPRYYATVIPIDAFDSFHVQLASACRIDCTPSLDVGKGEPQTVHVHL